MSLTNVSRQTLSLPTGRYNVTVGFERFQVERTAKVLASQTEPINFATNLAALHLTSEPHGAAFELSFKGSPPVNVTNVTPIVVSALPTGEYSLRIWHGSYRQTLPVILTNTATNELSVLFPYATVSVESDPDGAEVRSEGKLLGRTPVKLSLEPGVTQLTVSKPGFASEYLTMILEADKLREVKVTLVNQTYADAMRSARELATSSLASPEAVLEQVEKALEIKPNDPEALTLQRRAQAAIHSRRTREFLRTGKTEWALTEVDKALKLTPDDADLASLQRDIQQLKAREDEDRKQAEMRQAEERQRTEAAMAAKRAEERKFKPTIRFQKFMSDLQYASLFTTQTLTLNSDFESAYRRVTGALSAKPEWTVRQANLEEPELAVFQADLTSFGRRQKAYIVLGQTTDRETTVLIKLMVFSLGKNVQLGLSGVSDSSYLPLNPRYFPDSPAASIDESVAKATREFLERLKK